MGSALLGKRKRAINYPDVTKYLKQKFDAGKGGAKFKPTTVERMMRQEFPVEKLKSATEIKNIFSRFTLQEKGNKDGVHRVKHFPEQSCTACPRGDKLREPGNQ